VFEQQLGDEKAEPRSVEKLHHVFFEDGFFFERSGLAVIKQDWFHKAQFYRIYGAFDLNIQVKSTTGATGITEKSKTRADCNCRVH
jgi:hypothetical protein